MSAPISEIAGVDSPRPDDGALTPETRRRLIELLEAAHAFYLSRRERSWVPDYLAGRGLAIVEAGYAPGGWSTTIDALRADGFTDEELLAAGVATTSRRGTMIDRFRARLMLPMRNRSGDLVGFVGRATDAAAAGDKAPKYLNSPASALFDKSAVLLGLAEGAEALQAGAVAAIVEGPLDAYATTQAAQGQAVGLATCGTALTAAHISALGQVVDLDSHPITFAFDDDAAGTAAATKVWPVVAGRTGLDTTRCADLDGHDPAALLKTRGTAALVSAVCEPSRRLVDMHLDAVIARYDLDNALQIPPALEAAARSLGSLVHDDSAASLSTMMALADRHQELSPEWVADALVNAAAPAEEPAEPEESNTGGATVYEFPGSHQPTDEEDGHNGGGGTGGGAGGGGDDPRFERVIVRDRFRATDHGLYQVKVDVAKQKEFWTELLPVKVRLGARVVEVLGDGAQPEMTHVDLIASRGDEEHALPAVERRRWEQCSWVAELPWPAAFRDTNTGRSTLRNAIISTSEDAPLVKMYGALGWHEINGRWTYVHAGGAIDANGPVEGIRVNDDPLLKPFTLPPAPATLDELRSAVLASTAILDAIPPRLAAPLLGAAYRACLGFSPVTVMPVGPKASGKTGLAALAAQHYAPTARNRRGGMPGAGAGESAATGPGLEELRFKAGDILLPIDDLAPDRGTERASARAAEIARSQFNRTGKLRMKRDGGSRPTHQPRSLPVVTGEESTTVESAESRTVSLRVARGDVDTRNVLPALDSGEEPELRAKLTAAMVRHYAAAMPMGDWLDKTSLSLRDALFDHAAADPGTDTRHSESVADLATGWRAMLDMAIGRGALSKEEAAELWARAWEGLAEAKRHLIAGSATRTPADRVRELLTSALVRRDVTLLDRNGGTPENPEKCGWEENSAAGQTGAAYRPVGTTIGWTDGVKVWLQPGAAFRELRSQAKAEDDPLTYTSRGLGQALADSGVIRTRMRNGIRSTTVNVRLGAESEGGRYAVWEFDYGWLFPHGVDDDDDLPPVPPAPAPAVPPVQFDDVPTIGDDAEPEPEPEPEPTARPDRSSSKHESTKTQTRMQDDSPSFQRSASMRRSAAVTSYRAVAAVCEPTCAWLAKPGAAAETVQLPQDAGLETLLSELAQLKLGHADGRGSYYGAPHAWGQAWITEDLRRALGWPATVDASPSAGKVRRSLEAAGWKVLGRLGFWTRIAHKDGPRLALVVPEWRGGVETMLEERSATPAELAYRLARYAEVTGIAWQWSPDTTGQQLAIVTRPRLRDRWRPENGGPTKLPAPAGNANRERPFVWQRPPTPDEERMPYVHLYDFNALYAGAARSLPLAWGEFEHVKQPSVDLNRPGYWAIPQHKWEHALLPDPFAVLYRNERDTMIVTTPTLKIARELLDWDIEPVEAWLAVETLAGDYTGEGKPPPGFPGAKGYGRLLDKWAKELLNGRAALAESQVADDAIVATNVKATYAQGVGRFDMRAQRPGKGERVGKHPLWRPDWRHHIIAQGRYAIMRRILKAADTDDRYPLAIMTDAVVYASDVPDWAAAAPTAFNPGNAAGEVSPPATAPMASVVDLLRKGTIPATRGERTPGLADVIKNGGAADG